MTYTYIGIDITYIMVEGLSYLRGPCTVMAHATVSRRYSQTFRLTVHAWRTVLTVGFLIVVQVVSICTNRAGYRNTGAKRAVVSHGAVGWHGDW